MKPCRLPNLIDHYRRCELFGVSDDGARQRFRTFMQQPADAAGWAQLGSAYVEQARLTVDPTLYPKSESALRRSLARR